jgi:hypothetical protein
LILCCLLALALRCHAQELRAAFVEQCPTSNFPTMSLGASAGANSTSLPAAFVGSLADSLIDAGIAKLKKTVNPGNATLEGQFLQQGLYVYRGAERRPDRATSDPAVTSGAVPSRQSAAVRLGVGLSPKLACLVVAAGNFAASGKSTTSWKLPFAIDTDDASGPSDGISRDLAVERLASALGVDAVRNLTMYFEAGLVFSSDHSALTWKPLRLYIGEYLHESFWAGRSRSTLIEMRLYRPGKKEPFYAQEFAFAQVSKPLDWDAARLAHANTAAWNVLPPAPTVPALPGAAPYQGEFDPFTLEVRIVEAPQPYALAQAFAQAADSNHDKLRTQLVNAIDPASAAAAGLSGANATLNAIANFQGALKTASSLCSPTRVTEAAGRLACAIARDRADLARQTAELSCQTVSVQSCADLPAAPDLAR